MERTPSASLERAASLISPETFRANPKASPKRSVPGTNPTLSSLSALVFGAPKRRQSLGRWLHVVPAGLADLMLPTITVMKNNRHRVI